MLRHSALASAPTANEGVVVATDDIVVATDDIDTARYVTVNHEHHARGV